MCSEELYTKLSISSQEVGMAEVLDYLKDRYSEEQARFTQLEDKSSKILGYLSILIGVLGAGLGFKESALLSPHSLAEWLRLGVFVTALLCVICSWGHSLLALKINDCPVMPRSRLAIEWMTCVEKKEWEKHLVEWYANTIDELSSQNDRKARNIELCYSELTFSAWALGLFAIVATTMELMR